MKRVSKRRRLASQMIVLVAFLVQGATVQVGLSVEETWAFREIIQADGRVHLPDPRAALCEGWKVMLDPMLRARFVYTGGASDACRARAGNPAKAYWDDELLLPGVTAQVRAFRAGDEVVYVDSRFLFRDSGITVSGILKWEATTGRWHVVGNAPEAPSGLSAAR